MTELSREKLSFTSPENFIPRLENTCKPKKFWGSVKKQVNGIIWSVLYFWSLGVEVEREVSLKGANSLMQGRLKRRQSTDSN